MPHDGGRAKGPADLGRALTMSLSGLTGSVANDLGINLIPINFPVHGFAQEIGKPPPRFWSGFGRTLADVGRR